MPKQCIRICPDDALEINDSGSDFQNNAVVLEEESHIELQRYAKEVILRSERLCQSSK